LIEVALAFGFGIVFGLCVSEVSRKLEAELKEMVKKALK
jgi:hypothetical protein